MEVDMELEVKQLMDGWAVGMELEIKQQKRTRNGCFRSDDFHDHNARSHFKARLPTSMICWESWLSEEDRS